MCNSSFVKRCKIFISHKRENGQARPETLLIYSSFESKIKYHARIDVRESYLGSFPDRLRSMIQESDVFIVVLPKDKNLEFLRDSTNWVYQEIQYALTLVKNGKLQILPVAFTPNFRWADYQLDENISELKNYSIMYFDTNDRDASSKLLDSIKYPISKLINFKLFGIYILLFAALISYPAYRHISNQIRESMIVKTLMLADSLSKDTYVAIPDSILGNADVQKIVKIRKLSLEYFSSLSRLKQLDRKLSQSTINDRFISDLQSNLTDMAIVNINVNDAYSSFFSDEFKEYIVENPETSVSMSLYLKDYFSAQVICNKCSKKFKNELEVIADKRKKDIVRSFRKIIDGENLWNMCESYCRLFSIGNDICDKYLKAKYGL